MAPMTHTKQYIQRLAESARTAIGTQLEALHTRRLALALADVVTPHLPDEETPQAEGAEQPQPEDTNDQQTSAKG